MFAIALCLGLLGNSIFFLGLIHQLNVPMILVASFLTVTLIVHTTKQQRKAISAEVRSWHTTEWILIALLILASAVNLIGALGPEIAFDALWYHLTLPKLYLHAHSIFFIPGGLLYYSAMPRLGEMFLTIGLAVQGAVFAKLIQWLFGMLMLITTYLFAKRFVNKTYALLACVILASNLVFAWESTTGFIDLIRTFFEITALWSWFVWHDTSKKKYLLFTGIFLGFALETKLLAIGSVAIIMLMTFLVLLRNRPNDLVHKMYTIGIHLFLLVFPSLILILPWFLFSWIHAGSPFYPFFPKVFDVEAGSSLSPFIFLRDTWALFVYADDPLTPIYIMTIPFLLVTGKQINKFLIGYCFLSFLFWYSAPHIGQARYFLPYLPAWSVFTVVIISHVKDQWIKKSLIAASIVFLLVTIGYRGIANKRYLPVILGQETETHFLTTHLNFSFGDFVDSDGWFAQHIRPTDTVLLINFHNLYYVNFPFLHDTWREPGNTFDYVAVQNAPLPPAFAQWHEVYANPLTHVRVYKL